MAPNPWGKKPVPTKASGIKSPDLQSPKNVDNMPPTHGRKSQYEETQEDELIALAAIYGEDFQLLEAIQGAWKVGRHADSQYNRRLILLSRNLLLHSRSISDRTKIYP